MATNDTPDKDKKPTPAKPIDTKAEAEATKDASETVEESPQAQPDYKPDQNTITDNRRSDYDQPNLANPQSQKVTKDESIDEEADKPENHKGEKAWDIDVKEDDEANKKEAAKEAPKVIVQQPKK